MKTYVLSPDRSLAARRLLKNHPKRVAWSGHYKEIFKGLPDAWYRINPDGTVNLMNEVIQESFEPFAKGFRKFAIAIEKAAAQFTMEDLNAQRR